MNIRTPHASRRVGHATAAVYCAIILMKQPQADARDGSQTGGDGVMLLPVIKKKSREAWGPKRRHEGALGVAVVKLQNCLGCRGLALL